MGSPKVIDINILKLPYLPLPDYDALFRSDPSAKVILCNDRGVGKQKLESTTTDICMESRELQFVATCQDGCTRGNFHQGTICPICNTPVEQGFIHELRYNSWFEIPEFMPPVLHPTAYRYLAKWLGAAKKAPPLLNQLMSFPEDKNDVMPGGLEKVLGRGMTYFYANFDNIIQYLANNYPKVSSPKNRKKTEMILEFVKHYRSSLFTRHLPLLNPALHLVTKAGSIRRTDNCGHHAAAAKVEFSLAVHSYNSNPDNTIARDTYLYTGYKHYLAYTKAVTEIKLTGKKGHIRTNIAGSRVHCSFRAVIIPQCGEHMGDELHMPWKLMVASLKLELINLLRQQRKLTEREIHAKLARAMVEFDEDIYNLLNRLIRECPYKGLPVIFGRNPKAA